MDISKLKDIVSSKKIIVEKMDVGNYSVPSSIRALHYSEVTNRIVYPTQSGGFELALNAIPMLYFMF